MSNTRVAISVLFLSLAGLLPLLESSIQPPKALGAEILALDKEGQKAGEERSFEIAPGVKMEFCWIPKGQALLGSPGPPLPEKEREKERSPDETEYVYETKTGFWMGKFHVTQEEWQAVMGNNPSWFQVTGGGKNKLQEDRITDTRRFPVEQVTWEDCQKFLKKVNERHGVEEVFGRGRKFLLPREGAWEYACRGGKGNGQAYFFGDILSGVEANCDGNVPFNTKDPFDNGPKGPFLDRTCSVDYTNGGWYKEHPWGLRHITGNLWQWCDNRYDPQRQASQRVYRAFRGGSWLSTAKNCRTACRNWDRPDWHFNYVGFRVCVDVPPLPFEVELYPSINCGLSSAFKSSLQHGNP